MQNKIIKRNQKGGASITIIVVSVCAVLFVWGFAAYKASQSLEELFLENKRLKQAVTNLTKEEQIWYAKVEKQETINGKLITSLKFVETARDDKNNKILTKKFTIEGDIIHFDALIVKFDTRMVMDGNKKAMYLWRRVYGENMSPSDGLAIEVPGEAPARYKDIFEDQSLIDKLLLKDDESIDFWNAIWDLVNDPDKLKKYGVQAVYGNAVYSKLRSGLIYVFKITNTGHLFPDTVPEM